MIKYALDCSKCGAPLEITETTSLLDCPYCRTKHLVENIDGSIKLESIKKRLSTLEIEIQDKFPKSINQIQEEIDKIKLGDNLSGTVTRIKEFGAFIEIEPGIEAFIHISQLSPKKFHKITDVIKVGDRVNGIVHSINPDSKVKDAPKLGITLLPILENWNTEKIIQHIRKLNKNYKG